MKKKSFLSVALAATALSMSFTACSDNDDNVDNNPPVVVSYVWGTDGSIKTCDHLLFSADGKEDVNGKVIGNGDKEFIFNGKWFKSPFVLLICLDEDC